MSDLRPFTTHEIARAVELMTGFSVSNPSRRREVVRAKKLYIVACVRMTSASLRDIGKPAGELDHTTVIYHRDNPTDVSEEQLTEVEEIAEAAHQAALHKRMKVNGEDRFFRSPERQAVASGPVVSGWGLSRDRGKECSVIIEDGEVLEPEEVSS